MSNNLPNGLIEAINNCDRELKNKIFKFNDMEFVSELYPEEEINHYLKYKGFEGLKYQKKSQRDLARVLGVSKSTVARWEKGVKPFSVNAFEKVRNSVSIKGDVFSSESIDFKDIMAFGFFSFYASPIVFHKKNSGKKTSISPRFLVNGDSSKYCINLLEHLNLKYEVVMDKKNRSMIELDDIGKSYLTVALFPELKNFNLNEREFFEPKYSKLFPNLNNEIKSYVFNYLR